MAERNYNPNSPACGQWEMLLADSLDGLLKPEDEAVFTAHMAVCPACAALFEEARRGREWLEFLSPEPEVPAGLLDKILAQTGPGTGGRLQAGDGRRQCSADAPGLRSGLAAPRHGGPHPALCRAAPADDGGHGLLLHRPDAQPDRRPSEQPASLRPAAQRSAFIHGTAVDHGLDSHHPLLRPTRAWSTRSSPGCGSCAGRPRSRAG